LKAVDPDRNGLGPLSDVIPNLTVEPTAKFVASKRSQIAASIDEKQRIGDIVFLGESMQEHRAGSVPWRLNTSTLSSSFDSVSIPTYSYFPSI